MFLCCQSWCWTLIVLGRRLAARYIGWGEIIVGLAESNGSLMASVTCGLTAEDWDQLRNPTLVLNMGLSLGYWQWATRYIGSRPWADLEHALCEEPV